MSLKLRVYLVLVALTAAGLLALYLPPLSNFRWAHYVIWTGICFVSEMLWMATLSGEGTASMASTANLATAMLWGQPASMWIVCVSTVLANLLVQKKPWVRAVFNTSQSVITMWASTMAMILLGGPAQGLVAGHTVLAGAATVRLVLPLVGLVVGYFIANRALVAVAVAWSTDRAYLRVLREDWVYRERLFDDTALVLLAPLAVISYEAIGYLGMLLFYAPLRIIYDSHQRYIELRNAQKMLIQTERMAAKGEMAAEIGHELRNQLVAISGRAQMLLRDSERNIFTNIGRHAQIILEQSKRMEGMSKGLMDFSRAELRLERVDFNALIQRTVEIIRPQNRFDGVEWDIRLSSDVSDLRADPGQLQDVLINLFINAADAMGENGTPRHKVIRVGTQLDDRARAVRFTVQDTGPGIRADILPRVFDPHFTTKPEGHGFGLSTSYRIVANHGGLLVAESPPGEGARFVVTLPLQGPGGLPRA